MPGTLKEAGHGAQVSTPTSDGPVKLKVPAGSSSGAVLRLKGRGLAKPGDARNRGDQLVRLAVKLPEKMTDAFKRAVADLPDEPVDPRRKAGLT